MSTDEPWTRVTSEKHTYLPLMFKRGPGKTCLTPAFSTRGVLRVSLAPISRLIRAFLVRLEHLELRYQVPLTGKLYGRERLKVRCPPRFTVRVWPALKCASREQEVGRAVGENSYVTWGIDIRSGANVQRTKGTYLARILLHSDWKAAACPLTHHSSSP